MGRKPCCSKVGLNRGTWTAQEDRILTSYIKAHGEGQWRNLPKRAGLKRCGKSCRLRWMNYLKPDLKRGNITPDEEDLIVRLHRLLGNRWSLIAGRLPGRTDNEIKNYWHTILRKKLKPDSSPTANYKGPLKTTAEGTRITDENFPSVKVKISTELLKPIPTKATRPVKCLEFPVINSNPPMKENFDLHHSDLELPIYHRGDQVGTSYSSGDDDLGFFDFENNGDDPFPASNCLTMEALLMEECIHNVHSGGQDENDKNSLVIEGLDMFLNTEQWP